MDLYRLVRHVSRGCSGLNRERNAPDCRTQADKTSSSTASTDCARWRAMVAPSRTGQSFSQTLERNGAHSQGQESHPEPRLSALSAQTPRYSCALVFSVHGVDGACTVLRNVLKLGLVDFYPVFLGVRLSHASQGRLKLPKFRSGRLTCVSPLSHLLID